MGDELPKRNTRLELVTPIWKNGMLPLHQFRKSRWQGTILRHQLYKSCALPTELHRQFISFVGFWPFPKISIRSSNFGVRNVPKFSHLSNPPVLVDINPRFLHLGKQRVPIFGTSLSVVPRFRPNSVGFFSNPSKAIRIDFFSFLSGFLGLLRPRAHSV